MNFETFRKWLDKQLVPNLKVTSVHDDAAYNNVQQDQQDASAYRKADIQKYLQCHDIPFGENMLKAELFRNV